MFSPEARRIKSGCWGSQWKAVERDENGRPTRYVKLTTTELAQFLAFGRVQIPQFGGIEA